MIKISIIFIFYFCSTTVYGSLPQNCGKPLNTIHANWRVVGGIDAALGEFPWFSLTTLAVEDKIHPQANNYCGGSIINERWILTAAHCVPTHTKRDLKVRLGVLNMTAHEEKEVDVYIEQIVVHENYVITREKVLNDIALIKMNLSLDFSGKHKHLMPICLAKNDTKLTQKCNSCGFGSVNSDPAKPQHPKNGILQKVDIPLTDPKICARLFPAFNDTLEVCAGAYASGGHSVCEGDSGGPLQCKGADGRWYQIGIVSYGPEKCGLPHEADVYMKVSAYLDWIEKKISNN